MKAVKVAGEGRAQGRIFQNKARKVWMLAYCGPRPDGTWGEIRESAQTRDEAAARKALARRLRQAANHRDGLSNFEAPSQRRVVVTELLEDLLAEYRRREIKGYERVWYRVRKGSPLEVGLGSRRVDRLTTDHVVAYTEARRENGLSKASVNRDVELLGAALRLALQKGKIARAPKMPGRRLPQGPMPWSYQITAAASSTVRLPRSRYCRKSWRRSTGVAMCCSMAAYARVRTSPKRSPWEPAPA